MLHENQKKNGSEYAIDALIPHWEKAGYKVIIQRGIYRFTRADLLFVHLDLSLIPDNYQEFINKYPAAVNGRVSDIRKRTVSLNLVSRNDGYNGQVIVKSNYNYNGIPEKILLKDKSYKSPFDDYIIFDRADKVPATYWDHPNVVVEKFLPETENSAYFIREYLFLGNEEIWIRLKSMEPIAKAKTVVEYQSIEPEPYIREIRLKFDFDYGKFDYVVHDGTPILLDANKTQGKGLFGFPQYNDTNRRRARGIESFF